MTTKVTSIKHGNVMDGYHAIEHKSFVAIYDPDCAPYVTLYKRSSPDAVRKAKEIIQALNIMEQETACEAKEIAILKDALAQKDKNSTALQFDMAAQIDKVKADMAKLSDHYDKVSTENRRTQEQSHFMRSVIENQSMALRNMSHSLEK